METVKATPLTARCARIYAERDHALLGVSALNGYFSLEAVTELLRWALARFARTDVLLPGPELAGTLAARGYDPDKARSRSRKETNRTRNRVARALASLGDPKVGVFTWTDLRDNPAYRRLHAEVGRLFATDSAFKEHCVQAVAPLVATGPPSREQIDKAMPFLLAELPLVLDSPGILGTRSSVFCYPRLLPLAERLYSGTLPVFPRRGQGILTTRLTRVVADADHYGRGGHELSGTQRGQRLRHERHEP
ncbi:tRNA-dependent cyclodipeptide synthase [Nonomuraea sp. NPDC049152]|uniref:tRNA-dependent cyclodipeptide synthase n=1 Tax=Nonomuraea sp. NPDC049152 TaxID=3154350 RepID=UPI003402F88B